MEKKSVEELELFIEYIVAEKKKEAFSYLLDNSDNQIMMSLFAAFYTEMPEAHDEPLLRAVYLDGIGGTFLI